VTEGEPMTEPLDPGAASEVLRRAAELSARDVPRADGGYDRRSLTEAASEVGIERRAVELALAEHDAGLLGAESRRGGLLGPSRVVEVRVVDCDVPTARAQVIHWLRGQLLSRDEKVGSAEVWRPREDLGAKVRRKVDARVAKKVRLTDVDAVEVSTAAAGDGRTLIRLEAVFDDMRRGLRTGVVVIPAAVTPVLGVALAVLTEPWVALASLPAAGALGAAGTYAGRRSLADQLEDARRALRRFLDDVEDAAG
jgi:hypothetical protein